MKNTKTPPKTTKKRKENTKIIPLVFEGKTYRVPTTYKHIKNIRLKIRWGNQMTLSVPIGTKQEDIQRFCKEHYSLILNHIAAMETRSVAYAMPCVKDGDSFSCFGEQLTLSVHKGTYAAHHRSGKVLYLSLRNPESRDAVNRLFRAWQKETVQKYMTYLCQCHFENHFKTRGVAFPKIEAKAFWARWGSCYYRVGRIEFSTALLFTSPDHANYVALHEMAHLVHGDHSQRFYGLLDELMPDWRDQRAKASALMRSPDDLKGNDR